MSDVPQIKGKKLIKTLQKVGFKIIRQKGSHVRLERIIEGHRQLITIPVHNRPIKPGTLLNGILKPIDISLDDLKKLLK